MTPLARELAEAQAKLEKHAALQAEAEDALKHCRGDAQAVRQKIAQLIDDRRSGKRQGGASFDNELAKLEREAQSATPHEVFSRWKRQAEDGRRFADHFRGRVEQLERSIAAAELVAMVPPSAAQIADQQRASAIRADRKAGKLQLRVSGIEAGIAALEEERRTLQAEASASLDPDRLEAIDARLARLDREARVELNRLAMARRAVDARLAEVRADEEGQAAAARAASLRILAEAAIAECERAAELGAAQAETRRLLRTLHDPSPTRERISRIADRCQHATSTTGAPHPGRAEICELLGITEDAPCR